MSQTFKCKNNKVKKKDIRVTLDVKHEEKKKYFLKQKESIKEKEALLLSLKSKLKDKLDYGLNNLNNKEFNYYLEIKTSSVEGRYKTRKIISRNEFEIYKKNGILDNVYGTCLPNLYVNYEREYVKIDDVRVSIDKKITYKNFLTSRFFFDNNSIVELKTSINKNIDDLAKAFPFQKIRFSKYCFAVEKLN